MWLVAEEALGRERPAWSDEFYELVDLEGDGSWAAHLTGDLDFVAEAGRVRVSGTLTGAVPRTCDRCLGVFLEPVTIALAEVCLIEADAAPGGDAVFDEDHEVWRVAPEGRLSVTELVRQAVLLALPTRALCESSACLSGAALGQTGAGSGPTDPRLAVLGKLLEPEVSDGGPEEANE